METELRRKRNGQLSSDERGPPTSVLGWTFKRMTAFQNPDSGAILGVTGKVKLTTSLEKNELSLKAVNQFQMQASLPGQKLETD